MLYPLLCKPVHKKMIWGSESWDITCRPAEMSIIENGPCAGQTLAQYIAQDKAGLLGTRVAERERFPLLVKIIDAKASLSVQVHPDDAYAAAHENGESGKNEMWYIIRPPEAGFIYCGLQDGVTRADFTQAYASGAVEACFHRLPVRSGEIVNIPAGLVHALTAGAVIAEVQQNADITYRLYDYGRVGPDGLPRTLHRDAALATADFDRRFPRRAVPGLAVQQNENRLTYAIANRYFAVIKYEINTHLREWSSPAAFSVFTCVEGQVWLDTPGFTVSLPACRSVLIPAALGEYTLRGAGVLLKSFVPDVDEDFIAPLRRYGYTDREIAAQTALCPAGI